ncbi:APC family permease [Paracoccus laeviglucosivorans]|uniref:Amino acid/polyamine/organocation transporter, APC superfamily n=1 Tax=Paracoccus laeviglucosivorans TaxID=1197861 RepID=A0A521CT31_9RHOB|nr:APC family permease [Paracoccus laeviglucosivorans]SMO62596.1 amino acid/polyamine/organocation transporter, APC superfamily [Paracoccus laeviglucosivorans]
MTAKTQTEPGTPHQPELKRVMGPKLLLLFIVGDILGTGVYALTGTVAGEVGGAAWAPFLVAFLVATITAMSYLELVTRYPQAAGAALYTHRAFGIHFLTFLVAFTVMCSGITSASTASNAFAGFLNDGFGLGFAKDGSGILILALGFMALVALINFRGVGESVKANVVLTLVELSGLLMVIFIGFYAMSQGRADFTEVMIFRSADEKGAFMALTAATALAFFAMVGFEDSVNMAEEVKDPVRIFPRIMLTGLAITGVIYVLVAICAVALVPVGQLSNPDNGSALTQVVRAGAPGLPFDKIFPFIGMFAVANSALINMLMASRLLYGLARQRVLPHALGLVHHERRTPWVAIIFTTLLAFGLIYFVVTRSATPAVSLLGGTTSLLLLAVFTIVNISLLVLRKHPVEHEHFRTPAFLPWIGAITCAFLVGPWARSEAQMGQYRVAAWLLGIGIILWIATYIWNRSTHRPGDMSHIDDMSSHHGDSPRN